MLLLSHYQASQLLKAHRYGDAQCEVSPDLNRTLVTVELQTEGVKFPEHDAVIDWDALRLIRDAENACFKWQGEQFVQIRTFSEETNWARSLFPTQNAPSMLVSGMVMHRIAGIDPMNDTLSKIKAIGSLTGHVLDTCTGLGYTAIEASRTAEHVTTVELDPASFEIARENPWSQELFDNPTITAIIDDVFDFIEDQSDATFNQVIHDPPTFSFAGELYSTEFYKELHRVLTHKGRVFHYIGDPGSKTGQRVQRGVVRRLNEAGFRRVVQKPRAFGVVAYK